MTKAKIIGNLVLLILILAGCNQDQFDFHGKWQPLNEKGFIIEIKKMETIPYSEMESHNLPIWQILSN